MRAGSFGEQCGGSLCSDGGSEDTFLGKFFGGHVPVKNFLVENEALRTYNLIQKTLIRSRLELQADALEESTLVDEYCQ